MKRWVVAATVLLGVALVAGVAIRGPITTLNDIQTLSWPSRFSGGAWAAHPQQRWKMAIALRDTDALQSRDESSVVAELGAPIESNEPPGYRVLYWDTPAPQRPGDQLIVVFTNGRVTSTWVTSDRMNVPENN